MSEPAEGEIRRWLGGQRGWILRVWNWNRPVRRRNGELVDGDARRHFGAWGFAREADARAFAARHRVRLPSPVAEALVGGAG